MKKQIAMELLLFVCGAVIVCELLVVRLEGYIDVTPDSATLVLMELAGAIGLFVIALAHTVAAGRANNLRQALVGICLGGVSGGFIIQFLLPWMYPISISDYYGHEPGSMILLGETLFFAFLGTVGLINLAVDLCRLRR